MYQQHIECIKDGIREQQNGVNNITLATNTTNTANSIKVALKGVSSKMTYNFYWPDRISIFFENFLKFTSLKNFHLKVKFEAKNDLVKVGV